MASNDLALDLSSRIISARGSKVLLDSDLAALYGISTMRFNEAIKRKQVRFPADFCFRLTEQEVGNLISQFAISSLRPAKHGGRRKSPLVFTEHGAVMAATVLNSDRAIQMSIYVVRAFVELKKSHDTNATAQRLTIQAIPLHSRCIVWLFSVVPAGNATFANGSRTA